MATAEPSDISAYEVIPTNMANDESVNKPTLPCYFLGYHIRNPSFFGRKDVLLRLDQTLLPDATTSAVENFGSSPGPKIFAICGIGGIGKTQLAMEFAFHRMDCYDAIFLLHADDATKLAKDFGDISVSLSFEKVVGDPAVSKDLVLDWLSRPHGRALSCARTVVMYNNLSLSNIMIGQWDTAIDYADHAIAACIALNDPEHYPYFPIVSKGYALMYKGTAESRELAGNVLSDSLKHIRETFGDQEVSFRTGITILTLGDVRASQGRWHESLQLHLDALRQYLASIGPTHHRTAAAHVKVAEHYVRLGRLDEAKGELQAALDVLGSRPTYAVQIARICFRLARVQSLLGNEEGARSSKERADGLMAEI